MGTIKRNYSNNILSNGKFDATDLTGTIPTDNINGSTVQTIAGDPPAPANGQIWYNSVSSALKARVLTAGSLSWASGGNLSQARGSMSGGSGAGIQTACFVTGGQIPSNHNGTEEYDGSSWTAGTNFPTGRVWMGGTGTLTAGLIVGGRPPTTGATETWDGTNWTEANDLNTARSDHMGSWGTQTSGIVAAGYTTTAVNNVETWNGSSWTETTEVNTARYTSAGLGATNTNGLLVSGNGATTEVEQWNGSSWTETTELNTSRFQLNSSGTDSSGIVFAGATPPYTPSALTEFWNGSSWTEVSDLATARYGPGGSGNGSSSSALAFGGYTTTSVANTEEFTAADFTINPVTTS